jgi:hypothetical protein
MSSTAVVLLAILAALVVLALVDRLRRGRARPADGRGPEGGPPAR